MNKACAAINGCFTGGEYELHGLYLTGKLQSAFTLQGNSFANQKKHNMKYFTCLFGCCIHLLLYGQNLTGNWTGSLPQDDKTYTFTMQANILQSGNKLSGTCRYENPYQQWVILKFNGSIVNNVVVLNETEVVSCTNGLNWCVKKMTGYLTKDATAGKYIIEGNWTSNSIYDRTRYYRGYCAPGSFRITMNAPPEPAAPPVVPAITVSGQLLDATTLRPVKAVLTIVGSKTAKQTIYTDGEGYYTINTLPNETCHILIAANGYASQRETIQTGSTSGIRNFLLSPLPTSVTKKLPPDTVVAEPGLSKKFLNRDTEIASIITVNSDSVRLYFYDNGEVDNDTITVYYNKTVLLYKKRLTEKALVITVAVKNGDNNELVMYADNLGEIPPNTALLIFYDGLQRKEVTIKADSKKSGVIILKRKTASD